VLTDKEKIEVSDLPQNILVPQAAFEQAEGLHLPESGISMEEVEKKLICEALARTGGHRQKASKLLGMTYKTFQYRLKKYGIKL
jgi:two-component system response regulator AtoC